MMKLNKINAKQNFGMPIAKGTYLDGMKQNYLNMYKNLNEFSSPEYRKKVIEMASVLSEIDHASPDYIVGVYTMKQDNSSIFPQGVLYAYPKPPKKRAVQTILRDTNYPFLDKNDLQKILFYVRLVQRLDLE